MNEPTATTTTTSSAAAETAETAETTEPANEASWLSAGVEDRSLSILGLQGSLCWTVYGTPGWLLLLDLQTHTLRQTVVPEGETVHSWNGLHAVGTTSGAVVFDDLGRKLCTIDHGHRVLCVRFFRSWQRLLSADQKGFLYMSDPRTGEVFHRCKPHNYTIFTLDISPDDAWIVTGSTDNTAALIPVSARDMMDGRPLADPIRLPHRKCVRRATFSPDSRYLATASWDGFVRIRETAAPEIVLREVKHGGFATSVGFSPDGSHLLSGGTNLCIKVWSTDSLVTNPDCEPESEIPVDGEIHDLIFLNSRMVAAGVLSEKGLVVLDVSTGEELAFCAAGMNAPGMHVPGISFSSGIVPGSSVKPAVRPPPRPETD
eukprot:m.78998 g.78998  ORF g.78998 m.78998 type:complete len:373 (+) comp50612_c0_seq1:3-1121(+)